LLHHPKVLFLDEPTLGLDPQTRRSIWSHIQRLNKEKKITIILTTHYTEEADYLCGRILIIDFGKIVALDTSDRLKAQLEGDIVSLTLESPSMIPAVRRLFEGKEWIRRVHLVSNSSSSSNAGAGANAMHRIAVDHGMREASHRNAGDSPMPTRGGKTYEHGIEGQHGFNGQAFGSKRIDLLVDDGGRRIPTIAKLADEAGVALESVELHKPTLDDVFISVTGRNIRDQRGSFMDMVRRYRIMRQARGGQRHG
ncbi:MAG: AAA family ATPase, partial [Candidatus Bathyarchaeota archaeon]